MLAYCCGMVAVVSERQYSGIVAALWHGGGCGTVKAVALWRLLLAAVAL